MSPFNKLIKHIGFTFCYVSKLNHNVKLFYSVFLRLQSFLQNFKILNLLPSLNFGFKALKRFQYYKQDTK